MDANIIANVEVLWEIQRYIAAEPSDQPWLHATSRLYEAYKDSQHPHPLRDETACFNILTLISASLGFFPIGFFPILSSQAHTDVAAKMTDLAV